MPAFFEVSNKDFVRLAAELRGPAKKAVRKRVGKAIRAEVKPLASAVKRAVMATPSHSGSLGSASRLTRAAHQTARSRSGKQARLRGLRASIAAATGTEVNIAGRNPTVRIVVRRASLPPDQRRLPSRLNSASGWRHPVFGHRDRWVHQDGHPYFDVTIKRGEPHVRRAVIKALEAGVRDIARGV